MLRRAVLCGGVLLGTLRQANDVPSFLMGLYVQLVEVFITDLTPAVRIEADLLLNRRGLLSLVRLQVWLRRLWLAVVVVPNMGLKQIALYGDAADRARVGVSGTTRLTF